MREIEAKIKPAPESGLPGRVHLIGIGGDGMSGLAGLMRQEGHQISGSEQEDRKRIKQKPLLEEFQRCGVPIFFGHFSENISPETALVVRSSIIPDDNPEVKRAIEMGIPVIKRAEALGRLMERKQGIAVAGTAGKTTTTAMLGLILEKSDLDPSIMVGARFSYLRGRNYRCGRGPFVVEADEFDRSFLYLKYESAIVTNLFWGDHLDYYLTEEEMMAAFGEFVAGIPPRRAFNCLRRRQECPVGYERSARQGNYLWV